MNVFVLPDDYVYIPTGVTVSLRRERTGDRIIVTLPAGHTHECKKSHSCSYKFGEDDIFIGKNVRGNEGSRVGKRRAELICAAWACEWMVEKGTYADANELELCQTCMAIELSLQGSRWAR